MPTTEGQLEIVARLMTRAQNNTTLTIRDEADCNRLINFGIPVSPEGEIKQLAYAIAVAVATVGFGGNRRCLRMLLKAERELAVEEVGSFLTEMPIQKSAMEAKRGAMQDEVIADRA